MCILCFSNNHTVRHCKSEELCRFCEGRHHDGLHYEQSATESEGEKEKNPKPSGRLARPRGRDKRNKHQNANAAGIRVVRKNGDDVDVMLQVPATGSKISLSTGVIKVRNDAGKVFEVNCMGDLGSCSINVDAQDVETLGLKGTRMSLRLHGAGGEKTEYPDALRSSLDVLCPDGSLLEKVKVYCFPNPAGRYRAPDWDDKKKNWDHLKDLPLPPRVGDGRITITIGTRYISLMESLDKLPVRPTSGRGPIAKWTPVGWLTAGPMDADDVDTEDSGEEESNSGANGTKAAKDQMDKASKDLTSAPPKGDGNVRIVRDIHSHQMSVRRIVKEQRKKTQYERFLRNKGEFSFYDFSQISISFFSFFF